MPDIATYSHTEGESLRCEPSVDGLAAELFLKEARGTLLYRAGTLRAEVLGGCRLYVVFEDGVRELETGTLELDVKKGWGAILCSQGFYEHVFQTEMEIDRLKAADAGDWLELMLLRLIPRCMLREEFSALALIV